MKRLSRVLFAVFATAGMSLAAAQTLSPQAADLRTAMGGTLEPFTVQATTGVTCGSSTPGIVIHDDGEAENGYGFNTANTVNGTIVDQFTPTSYPATYTSVCFSFITNTGVTSLPFDVVVYDDDGAGGGPGTLLGSVSATATPVSIAGIPFTATFETFDISSLGLAINDGSVYIGASWETTAAVDGTFIAADLSTTTPLAGGYFGADGVFDPMVSVNPDYRAMMIRAVEQPAVPGPPSVSKSFSPDVVGPGGVSTLTITLSNISQPTTPANLTADFTDTFPANLVVAATPNASTTCTGGSLTATAGAGSVTLASGAQIPAAAACAITVDVTAPDGTYTNTIAAGDLVTDLGSNVNPASAQVRFGFVFPEPYCPVAFPNAVEPITLVDFDGINNVTDATVDGSPALEDFTSIIGNVSPGQTLTMTVEGNTAGDFLTVITTYIDWNQDFDFDDAGETYPIGQIDNSTGTDGIQAVADITVPTNALGGETRMRVIKKYNAAAPPCNTAGWGQAEDYTLLVAPPTPGLAKVFTPDTITVGENSTATITLSNPTAATATLTAPLTDNFPAGLDVLSANTTCGLIVGAQGVSLGAGESVTLPAGTQIPAGGSCDINVEVTSATAGSYTNTLPPGALQTDQGNNALAASATLTVEVLPVPPVATVTPASLDFTVATDETASQTLNIANAAGSDPLTFSIIARDASGNRFMLGLSDREAKLLQARYRAHPGSLAASGLGGSSAPALWTPMPATTTGGQLVFFLDDGSYENAIGWGDSTAGTEQEAVWINRFAPPAGTGAYTIDTISILWPVLTNGSLVGLEANLVVYYDPDADGDPSNAIRLGADTLVPISTLEVFIDYPVSFSVPGDGDVYIGFTDQWASGGAYQPQLFPAAIDQTASQGMSYVSADSKGPTDISNLANNDTTAVIGTLNPALAGNWMIRAVGTTGGGGGGGSCTGPVVSWLTANPASGTVNGGTDLDVTITADPSAGSLGAGTYNAELCITTNDPAQSLIVVPVTLTVTLPDGIFCNGFEAAQSGSCDDGGGGGGTIVDSGVVDISVPQTFDGLYINWRTGCTATDTPVTDFCPDGSDWNPWDSSGLQYFWPETGEGCVTDGTECIDLASGATIGPASTFAADGPSAAVLAGGTFYMGFSFLNSDTGITNYGYVKVTSTSPAGFPFTINQYWYDNSGAAITIP